MNNGFEFKRIETQIGAVVICLMNGQVLYSLPEEEFATMAGEALAFTKEN